MPLTLPTYRGYPVLDWRPDGSGAALDLTFSMSKTRFDAGTGRLADDSPFQPVPRTERVARYVVGSRARTVELEEFILTIGQGRLKPFWLPTWSPDVKLAAGMGPTDVDLFVTPFGYGQLLAGAGHGRQHLALWPQYNTLAPLYREVVAHALALDGTEQLTLDAPLGETLSLRDPVTFLLLCRAADDEQTIEWQNLGGVSIFELPIIDLPSETPIT